jgi:hypothetical protein
MQIFFAYNILGTVREMSFCTLVYGKCRTVCLIVAMPPLSLNKAPCQFSKGQNAKCRREDEANFQKDVQSVRQLGQCGICVVCLPTFQSGSHCAQSIQKWALRTAEERSNAAPLLPNHACISSHQCSHSFIKASKGR